MAVEEALAALLRTGRETWPTLDLAPHAFIVHLAERAPASEGTIALTGLRALHVRDLYLACACQLRVPGALELFESQILGEIASYLGRSEPSRPAIDEVCQQLRERLFVAGAEGVPKIAKYDGRGSLKSWLRVVAMRTAMTRRRSAKRDRTQPLDDAALAALPGSGSPELAILKQQHEADIKLALTEALAMLPADRVNVLRLHLIDGLTLEKIGSLYRVNRSSVKRWLDDARARLLSELRRRLQTRLRLSREEFDSLIATLRSQLDLSLSRILKSAAQ